MLGFLAISASLVLFLFLTSLPLHCSFQPSFINSVGEPGESMLRKFHSSASAKFAGRIGASDVLRNPQWPEKWPFRPQDFSRQDETSDSFFYDQPRLVTHIDDYAIAALTKYYESNLKDGSAVLDICSSWISHFPATKKFSRAAGLGMNAQELARNRQLTEYVAKDLNIDPLFPYADNSFDHVTCVVSVDYLTRPLEVFSEIKRVLKPSGTAIISQSNRCFPSKAIDIWLRTNDMEHIFIIGSYFHYVGGFAPAEAFDISPNPGRSDPMYIVKASKL